MLNSKIESALNQQINAEFWASYLYLGMSNFFAAKGLTGFAKWMKIQSEEEATHAHKLINYLITNNGKVELKAIAEVNNKWETPLDVFKQALAHEQKVTAAINAIQKLAIAENDYATQNLINWFIDEQVEEESTVQGIVDAFEFIGNDKVGVFMLNKELGARS